MARGDILVFASKELGSALVAYLLERGDPVRRVVVGREADTEILTCARSHGVEAEVYTEKTQDRIVAEGRRYEWLVNLWSNHILRAPLLALADHRINVHPSLVPHARGNDNAAWTLRKRLPAGVSLIEIREGVDTGEVYAQREVEYAFPIKGHELHTHLVGQAIALFRERWPRIHAGESVPAAQSGPVTAHRRRDTEEDRRRDGSETMTIEECVRWMLAHDFSTRPGTTAEVRIDGRWFSLRVVVEPGSK